MPSFFFKHSAILGKVRTDLTYDVLHPDVLETLPADRDRLTQLLPP